MTIGSAIVLAVTLLLAALAVRRALKKGAPCSCGKCGGKCSCGAFPHSKNG